MSDRPPAPSALRTWVTVLGFLAALLVVLGGFAYGIGSARHATDGHAVSGKG